MGQDPDAAWRHAGRRNGSWHRNAEQMRCLRPREPWVADAIARRGAQLTAGYAAWRASMPTGGASMRAYFNGHLWGQACDLEERLLALWEAAESAEDVERARRIWRLRERASARTWRRWDLPVRPRGAAMGEGGR